MIFSTEKLARNAALRPWRTVIAGMVIFIIGLVLVATLLGSATTEGQGSFNVDPESVKAQDLLEASGIRDEQRDTEIVVVSHDSLTVDDPRFQDKLNTVHAAIVALGAETVHDPGAVPNPTLLPAEVAERFYSENRRHVSIPVTLAGAWTMSARQSSRCLSLPALKRRTGSRSESPERRQLEPTSGRSAKRTSFSASPLESLSPWSSS